MIEHGLDDYTVMSISGHSSTRMLERYAHPPVERTRAALETFDSPGHKLARKTLQRRRTTKRGSRSCLIS
jgi:hypothetical protein